MNSKDTSKIAETIPKLMKQVQNWPRDRWKLLSLGLISILVASYMVYCSFPDILSNRSVLEKIQLEKKPDGLSTELWLLAEVRRSVAVQEKQSKIVALSLIECVTGIIAGAASFFILVPLTLHWKDGGREIQLIRLLLAYNEELEKK